MRTQTYPSMVHRGPQNKLVASLRPGMTVTPIEAIGNETVPSRGEPESENDGDDDEACENRPTSQPRRQKGRWSTLQGSISLWTPAEVSRGDRRCSIIGGDSSCSLGRTRSLDNPHAAGNDAGFGSAGV
jgi:hypothetical protein